MAHETWKDDAAFPIALQNGLSHDSHVDAGLTKLEYFSAKAMQSLIGAHVSRGVTQFDWEKSKAIANNAIIMAKCLIEELNKPRP